MNPGDWAWNTEHEAICRVIDVQTVWDHMPYRVWLPTHDAVVRVRADGLTPMLCNGRFLATACATCSPTRWGWARRSRPG
jgi:hypothetical protein